jgi:hypothetical protein
LDASARLTDLFITGESGFLETRFVATGCLRFPYTPYTAEGSAGTASLRRPLLQSTFGDGRQAPDAKLVVHLTPDEIVRDHDLVSGLGQMERSRPPAVSIPSQNQHLHALLPSSIRISTARKSKHMVGDFSGLATGMVK